MRLQLERSGGVTGRTTTWSVDADALDPDGRAELQSLVAESAQWASAPAAGADRFSYRLLTAVEGADVAEPGLAGGSEVWFAEPLAPPAQRLVSLVRAAST